MEVVEKLLFDLHASIESRDSYADSGAIVASIESIAFGEIDSLEVELCANLLFRSQNPPSLVEYIVQTTRVKDREVIKAKVAALKLLAQFIKENGFAVESLGDSLTVTLVDTFKKEESGEVKAALLLPLKNLFRCRIPRSELTGSDDSTYHAEPFAAEAIKLETVFSALLDEVKYNKKLTKGVLCESLKLLGIVAAVYPVERATMDYADAIINLCNNTLRENFKPSKTPEFPAIAGCFSCLDRIFYQYEDKCENNSELWKYLLQTMQTVNSPDVSKYAAAAKAVRFVKNHADLFTELIGLNAAQSYSILVAAHRSDKKAVSKHSADALSALMIQMSNYLVLHSKGAEKDVVSREKALERVRDAMNTLSQLVDHYISILKDTKSLDKEDVYIALKGVMSAASSFPRMHLLSGDRRLYAPQSIIEAIIASARHEELVASTLNKTSASNEEADISTQSPSMAFLQFSAHRKSLYLGAVVCVLFSTFIDGLQNNDQSSFVSLVTNPSVQVFIDEYVTLVLIGYVRLWKKQQVVVQSTLVKLMYLCMFGSSSSKSVSQHSHFQQEAILPLRNLQDTFFRTLLMRTSARKESNETLNVSAARISEYTGEMDDRLVFGYLSLWTELSCPTDKTIKTQILPAFGPSILENYTSQVLGITMQYLFNFARELNLSYIRADELNLQGIAWVPCNIVDQDLLINLVTFFSNFIKQQSVKLVRKFLNHFLDEVITLATSHPLVSSFYKLMDVVISHLHDLLLAEQPSLGVTENTDSIKRLAEFILNLQVRLQASQMDFQGELLDSCLGLILSIPITIIPMDQILPALKLSIKSGSNVLAAIQQLNRATVQDFSTASNYLPELLPLLSIYLERFAQVAATQNSAKSSRLVGSEDNSDQALQAALLELFGRIGGMNKLLLQSPSTAIEGSVSWSSNPLINLAVSVPLDPIGDIPASTQSSFSKLNLNLDAVLVQLTNLCQQLLMSGKDDQLLISCAEVFHSFMIVLIGNANLAQKNSEYAVAFKHTFPVILKLSSKQLKTKSMFELLLFQCIHWFSAFGNNIHEDDAGALLEVLFDSICDNNSDSAERDLAARGLEEYFLWSIKQEQKDVRNNSRIGNFMSKVVTLISHPLASCRKGCIMVLGKIYKSLREENFLVSKYGMQLLLLLLNTTRLDDTSETFKEHERLVFKYEEILALSITKRGWLNDLIGPNDERSIPSDLREFVSILWDNILSASNKSFRRYCMRCFVTFAPFLQSIQKEDAVRATKDFVLKWAESKGQNVLRAIDSSKDNGHSASNCASLDASLDIYTWLFTMDILTPDEFCEMSTRSSTNSVAARCSELIEALLVHDFPTKIAAFDGLMTINVIYRFIIWLQVMLSKSRNRQNVVTYMRNNGIWSERTLKGIWSALEALRTGQFNSTSSTAVGHIDKLSLEDFAGALRHLMRFLLDLEEHTNGSLICTMLVKFIETEWNKVLSLEEKSVSELKHARLVLSIFSSYDLDSFLYGAFSYEFKQHLIAAILERICSICQEQSDTSENSQRIDILFKLCVDMGLRWNTPPINSVSLSLFPFSIPVFPSDNRVGLAEHLRSDAGSLMLCKLNRQIMSAIFRKDSKLSWWDRENIMFLLLHLNHTNIASVWEYVLVEMSGRLSTGDPLCAELYASSLLPAIHSSGIGFLGLPDNLLNVLIAIDAEVALLRGDTQASNEFRFALLQDCKVKFQGAAKAQLSVLKVRLNWLPFLLRGTLSHSPRPWKTNSSTGFVSLFNEDKMDVELMESLDDLVAVKFPLDSKELNPATDQGKEYLILLDSHLKALEQCGSVVLLKPLLPSFRESDQHRYYSRLRAALSSVAGNVTIPDSSNESHDVSLQLQEVLQLCNFCVDMLLDPYQDFVIKRIFFDNLFLPTLARLSSKHIAQLFSSSGGLNLHQKDGSNNSSALVKTMYDIVCKDVPLSATSQDEFEISGNLYLQIACFKILGFLYDNCSLADLKGNITRAFVGSETVSGKELTQSLCKIAFKVVKNSSFCDDRWKDLFLELQANAYECLAITVSKTQSDEQFFDTFLFKVKPGEDLWTRVTFCPAIGDTPSTLFKVVSGNFPTQRLGWEKGTSGVGDVEFRRVAKMRKISMSARLGVGKGGFLSQYLNSSMLGSSSVSQSQSQSFDGNLQDKGDGNGSNLGNYSQSQYLDDDANLPSSTAGLRTYDVSSLDESVVNGWDDHVLYLEMNHVNTIPVMGTLVRTITRMHKLFAQKWNSQGTTKLPFWLQEFRTRLSDRSCPQRVRLFILRLLLNQPITEIVVPWISELFPAFLDCALEDLCIADVNSSDAKGNFNYFIRDLVFALCDAWKEGFPGAMCCYQATKFLNYLFQNVFDEDGTILKENTASVCTLLRVWLGKNDGASNFNLCLQPLVHMISAQGGFTGGAHARSSSRGTIAVRSRLAGLEIIHTLLECDYPLFCTSCDEAGALIPEILANVKFPRKEVVELACVVSGVLLSKKLHFESNFREHMLHPQLKSFREQLLQVIESQLNQKFGVDILVTSMRNVITSFPQFLTRELIMKTLHCFPQLKFRQRFQYLDALVRCAGIEGLKFTELLRPYYKALLSEVSTVTFGRGSVSMKVPVVQVATIAVLTKYREELTPEEVLSLIGDTEADGLRLCVNGKSALQVRDAAYQLLMSILSMVNNREAQRKGHLSLTASAAEEIDEVTERWALVKTTICQLLLNGLTDPDDAGLDLDWNAPHPTTHTSEHYENPRYWISSNSQRVGIRRRLLEFFNFEIGLSSILSTRLLTLMSNELFDPLNAEAWLKYSAYLSLLVFLSINNGSAESLLFPRPLGGGNTTAGKDFLSVPQYISTATISSSTPMFALERTTQSLSQLMNSGSQAVISTLSSQAAWNSIFSQANLNATQSFVQSKSGQSKGGPMIRGTQQFAWTQTQANLASQSMDGSSSSSVNTNNGNGPAQALGYGTYRWTQSQATESVTRDGHKDGADKQSAQETASVRETPRFVVTQRVPSRINTSMLDNEKDKNYALFRKVQVAKKLRGEEEQLKRRRVTFFRRYKTGELPDVCIPLSELMLPLSSLCLLHSGVSAQILLVIFSALHINVDFQRNMVSSVASMLSRMKRSSVSTLFTSVLLKELNALLFCSPESCQAVAELVANESVIADLSSESGNVYAGLSLLEDSLSRLSLSRTVSLGGALSRSNSVTAAPAGSAGDSQPGKRKRVARSSTRTTIASAATDDSEAIANELFESSRGARNSDISSTAASFGGAAALQLARSQTNSLWCQVLRLYDDLQEHEIMTSLTMKSLSDQRKAQSLKTALDAELRGEYLAAIDIYSDLLDRSRDREPTEGGGRKKRSAVDMEAAESEESKASSLERQLWFDRGLSCLNKLSDWGKLRDFLSKEDIESSLALPASAGESTSSSTSSRRARVAERARDISSDGSRQMKQRLVPHYLRSLLHCLPQGEEEKEEETGTLVSFVERMLSVNREGVSSWFENTCATELVTYFVLRKDWPRAKLYSEQAYKHFLLRWNALHPCALQARQTLLLELEPILELRDIVAVNLDKNLSEEHLVRLWAHTEPSLADPLHHWSTISMIRRRGFSSLSKASALHLAHLHVRTAVASVQQGVLSMVKPLLEKNSVLRKPVFGKKMVLTMDEVRVVSQYNRTSILRKPLDSAEIPGMLAKAHGLLQKKRELLEETSLDTLALRRGVQAETFQVTLMQADWSAFAAKYEQDKLSAGGALSATLAGVTMDSINGKKLMAMRGYLSSAAMLADSSFGDSARYRESCLSTVAQYCDSLLGEVESGGMHVTLQQVEGLRESVSPSLPFQPQSATEVIAALAAQQLIAGLQCGSGYCSERILRLVSIVGKYKSLLNDFFLSSLRDIPAWIFLRFSAQMLGSVDRPEGTIVVPVLEKVAAEYPQALLYSFRITSENFGQQGRALTGRLRQLLANKDADTFIEALTGLTHPELRWLDGMKEIDSRLKAYHSDTSLSASDKSELGKNILALFESVKRWTVESSWDNVGAKIGKYNAKWAKQTKAKLRELLGGKDEKLLQTKGIVEKLRACSEKSDPQLASGRANLSEFSQWLLDFCDIDGTKVSLEIPGQYAQYIKSKPAPELHEFIAGFDPKVLIMSSIRKPKRVKIYGHLGRESFFLVKGGEDLRNDERIEQLFMLMNHVIDSKLQSMLNPSMFGDGEDSKSSLELEEMKDSPSAVQPDSLRARVRRSFWHGYAARTYTVVPMSSKVGVLEWVQNTKPLKAIIAEELAKDEDFVQANRGALEADHSVNLSEIAACKERTMWIGGHDLASYHKMFKTASRDQAWKIFESITSKVPSDLLKRYFRRLSLNAEAFCTIRAEFAKSLSISNIFGYVLGLGDRHLENLMIDTKTGAVVQIDFGTCFGVGISLIGVPELIPFRLTPVLRDAVQPLDGLALARQFMVKVMQLLRDDASGRNDASYAGVIGNALEIYINDPVVDWLRGISGADKDELERHRLATESSGTTQWEPTRRVRMAIRRLKGEDPISLMLEDIQANAAVKKCGSYEALKKILLAVRKNTAKGTLGSDYISGSDSSSYAGTAAESSIAWGDSMLGGYSLASAEDSVRGGESSANNILPVQEQIDVLLKMATDPDVLARQWVGLNTWF